ncbi:hypothetical protein [Glaesserella parasuis]|uniref:hypothetical protein n=1 Tax=Glaesserella parasuis TaxID=738 RepID=UPI001365B70D|nr:hypothetical protein [Glaesserella parasuis]MCT8654843.1 hypothetical protein [Glaesserella parasuis]MCT8837311.1 hypothetical protein [Glaesserella parasuis]MDE4030026.1 hypothetical protein [Glaesserella parasuis]MDG6254869.1 hypothetical protein [Glaesserella parasuis]MDG6297910.1 hypothetical protein [Glaesserella parasuis]
MKLTGGRVAQKPSSKLDVFPEGIVLVAHSTIEINFTFSTSKSLVICWQQTKEYEF